MDTEELQQLAVELVNGYRTLEDLPEEVRKLAGKADTAMKAAHKLFALVPADQEHGDLSPHSVGARRAAAAWFSGDLKAAEKVFTAAAWKELDEKERLRMYDPLLNHATLEAEEQLEEVAEWVLKLAPAHPLAVKVKAVMIIRSGRPRAAVPLLEQVLKVNPEYASGWYNLACAWSLAGEKAPMLEALKKAIQYGAESLSDYRAEAWSDSDFERWREDADFKGLVRPMPEAPGAEELQSLYEGDRFDALLVKAAALMEKNPKHAATYATLARQGTEAVVGDLEEHGDANAEDYGLGGVDAYQSLDDALSEIEDDGGKRAVKRFVAVLEKLKGAKKKGAKPAAAKKKGAVPAAVKKGAKLAAVKKSAKPAAVKKGAKPAAAKKGAAAKKSAKPAAAKKGAKSAVKKGAKRR
ncbi:hypothetical protein [Myxococcus sp. RHSTA-1-4]|uniref:TPR end-of-group domain-containing protein n=1 Tax=Myxococcus sp. RHSTA-1-4 TaxID=2874601 RepID=UPI001CC05CF4|nr:hypothetical protein [Myxococcus sp. RHSTA-1-4]MBZ4417658.1 hypothetical protein [Myxococcus sp. RHSTA-1-4]